jgi:hypothetical protein
VNAAGLIPFPTKKDHYILKEGEQEEVELYTYIVCQIASILGKDESWA